MADGLWGIEEIIKSCAKTALNQIDDRQYEAEIRARGITKIIKLGIAFEGEKSLVLEG
ncbi:MAG: PD-(D/E)XK nuclease domain-containing protein [Candidatus Dependentiae bacterium]|nr:PD-(D/E)XK nuclease domain-containing protein [Candidatus Dependentiae bacterium]